MNPAVLVGVLLGWFLREHASFLVEHLHLCPVCQERRRTDMRRHPASRPKLVPQQAKP
jgi:hypothetical protein